MRAATGDQIMTVIRLDAATLAQVQAGKGPVYLADESGKPILELTGTVAVGPLLGEPELTEEEWAEIENDPVTYSLDEAWEKIRRGEKL
jgi:hypothetical protein